MLRWLIAFLILVNLLLLATVQGMFGPLPAAGAREPHHLLQQVHPEALNVRPLHPEDAADAAHVGAPRPDRTCRSGRSASKSAGRALRSQGCTRTFLSSAVVERSCSNGIASARPPQPRTSADSASVSMS